MKRWLSLALLALILGLAMGASAQQQAQGPLGDYGDAPDGLLANYLHVNPDLKTSFPSAFKSPSDHSFIVHRSPKERIYLGQTDTLENNALEVDRDLDDGWVRGSFLTCSHANLQVFVTVPQEAVTGPIYFNMLIDWNHDGRWADSSLCTPAAASAFRADEWANRNLRLDKPPYYLAPGFSGTVLLPEIATGPLPGELWMRLTISTEPVDENAFIAVARGGHGWNGEGDFLYGETEDWFSCLLADRDKLLSGCPLPLVNQSQASRNSFALTVIGAGNGNGTVTANSPGGTINCIVIADPTFGTCSASFSVGTTVILIAAPDLDSIFSGWSDCDLTPGNLCIINMTSDKTVTATFTLKVFTLALSKAGTGSGTVSGGGSFNAGDAAHPTATPDANSIFSGWSGPNGSECATGSVLMNADKACIATFTLKTLPTPTTFTLTLSTAGTGSGTVSGGGTFNAGDAAHPTATPDANSIFSGWSGPNGSECATGSVLMNADKACTATFTLKTTPTTFTLTVNKNGFGTGTVTAPAINCGSTCSASYGSGTVVTLTATPDTGSTFTAWSGCNSVSGNQCTVTMNSDKSVTATFDDGTWDKSSFTKVSSGFSCSAGTVFATFLNHGEAMQGSTTWELLFNGTVIATGTIPALPSNGSITLTEPASSGNGTYQFEVFQRPGHPGTGVLFSDAINYNC